MQFKSLISSGARVICQHILYEPSARGRFVILDQLSTIAQQLHLISFSFFRPGETATTYVTEMITANLPFVRRGDRQRDKSRARRRVRVLAITMLYISMLVLLALSRGFTIGGGAAARGSAVAALSTETNLSTGQGAAAGDHSQLDDRAATSVRRRSETKSGNPPQKLVLVNIRLQSCTGKISSHCVHYLPASTDLK